MNRESREQHNPLIEEFGEDIIKAFETIESEEVQEALETVAEDPDVGIRIIKIREGENADVYAALIRRYVRAHVHTQGNELYRVASGEGEMNLGSTEVNEDGATVNWQDPVVVSAGTSITVAPGQAHCLRSTGGEDEPLTLIFACPESHMKNTGEEGGDRIFVDNPPSLEIN